MSWQMQGVVAKLNHDISATEKWVLVTLASFTNKEGKNGYPSTALVADICRVTERTVRRVRARFFQTSVLNRVVGGGRGKGINYEFDPDRALELHYRKPEKADSVSGVELRKTECVSGFSGSSPVSESEKADSKSEKADLESGNPFNEPCKYPKGTPAYAHWRESRQAMIEIFGEDQVKAFLDPLVVGANDGQVIELYCPTRFWVDKVNDEFREGLERILGRQVRCVLKNVMSISISKRLANE